MRILITGSDGYLGSILAPELARLGHEIVGVDSGFFKSAWLHHDHPFTPATWRKDIRDITPKELEGFDAVVHMAELSNDPLGELSQDLTQRMNHHGSSKLAWAARSAGVRRFVYMSSCSVYGAAEGLVNERSKLRPLTTYAICKARVEDDLHRLATPLFSPTCLRNATAFGLSPRMRLDLVVNDLSALAHTKGIVAMSSDGTPWRPLVHALDIAQAVRLVLEAPVSQVADEVLNVGDASNNMRMSDVAKVVSEVFSGAPVTFGPNSGDTRSYAVDFEHIRAVLPGFHCAWSIERGVRQLRDAFELVGLNEEEASGWRYNRLATLRRLMACGELDGELRWRMPPLDGCRQAGPALATASIVRESSGVDRPTFDASPGIVTPGLVTQAQLS